MSKSYVLDTCILLADPHAPLRFDEHDVVIPLVVIEELDRKKTRMDEVGTNARRAIRLLEDFGASESGGLRTPVMLASGGTVRIEINQIDSPRLPNVFDATRPDHRILATCLNLSEGGIDTVLVTKDASLRIKAAQLDLAVQDYRADTVQVDELYSGVTDVHVDPRVIDHLFAHGKVQIEEPDVHQNEFIVLKNGSSHSGLGRVTQSGRQPIVTRVSNNRKVFGSDPKNLRQTFAMDLLCDPDVPAVTMMGMAGSGKTYLALAAALEQVVEHEIYRRVSIYRPLVAVGRQEVGFLPGDLDDKLAPWMAAVYDNLYALFEGAGPDGARSAVEDLVARNVVEMAAVTYLRGRSITNEIVIIDEAQNLELSTLKVIMTRMGRGSKVILCGDLTQVDNPYISPYGGVAALIEKFKGNDLFGHITLERSVRSPLSELAATTL